MLKSCSESKLVSGVKADLHAGASGFHSARMWLRQQRDGIAGNIKKLLWRHGSEPIDSLTHKEFATVVDQNGDGKISHQDVHDFVDAHVQGQSEEEHFNLNTPAFWLAFAALDIVIMAVLGAYTFYHGAAKAGTSGTPSTPRMAHQAQHPHYPYQANLAPQHERQQANQRTVELTIDKGTPLLNVDLTGTDDKSGCPSTSPIPRRVMSAGFDVSCRE